MKKELAKEKKQAKEEKKKDTICTVASLKKHMAEVDDAFDMMLKPQGTSKRQCKELNSNLRPRAMESRSSMKRMVPGTQNHSC